MNLVITIDDLRPSCIPLMQPLVNLHKNIPHLRLTCFVTPYWFRLPEEDITKSNDFKQFVKDNKSWIEFGTHGLTHCNPPENLRPFETQKIIALKAKKMMEKAGLFTSIYKPPGYQFNHDTFSAILKSLFKSLVLKNTIIRRTYRNKEILHSVHLETNHLFQFHIGAPHLQDDISNSIAHLTFLTKHNIGKYSTISEYINNKEK